MIQTQQLSKRYVLYPHAADRLHDWLLPFGTRRGREFWALKDITLNVPKGSALGVVGANGAGKSTLLKLLTGTAVPTSGTFRVEGRVAALLELGTGFHPQFTGRENIAFNGRMLGLSEAELNMRTPEMIEFSELGDFIDQPLRTYSSGMALRLAFSVAASVSPDVLIVDEALAVGDLHFQQKCLARIRKFHEAGVTVLFVSHDPALIKTFCTDAILLDGGRIKDQGNPATVLDHYNALLAERFRDEGSRVTLLAPETKNEPPSNDAQPTESEVAESQPGHRVGNFQARIEAVEIISAGVGGNSQLLSPGAKAVIRVRCRASEAISAPTVGILIKDRLGNEVYGINTHGAGLELGEMREGEFFRVDFETEMNLGVGLYSITAAIHTGHNHTEVCYDWIERAAGFQILPSASEPFIGVCRLPMRIQFAKGE